MTLRTLILSAAAICLAACQSVSPQNTATKPSPLQSLVGQYVIVHVHDIPDANGVRLRYISGTVCQVTDGWLVLAVQIGKPHTPNQWVSTSWIEWVAPADASDQTTAPGSQK